MNEKFYAPNDTQKVMFVHDFEKAYDTICLRFYLLNI